MNLTEIGKQLKAKRLYAGLTQQQAGKMSGLSRVTINQLENGTLTDLGYNKLHELLSVFGLDIEARPAQGLQNGLANAARTASTSYQDNLTPEMLAQCLRTGVAPEKFHPHLMVLLDEAPLPVVVRAIEEAAQHVPAQQVVKHLAKWSKEWGAHRAVWS